MGTQAGHDAALRAVAVLLLWVAGSGAAGAIGPYDARNGDECRAQVNANYDAVEADMRAHGNYAGIAAVEDEWRGPGLLDCERLDRLLQQEQLSAAMLRLSSAIDNLRAGHTLTAGAIQRLDADRASIVKMSARPYRREYLLQYADYQRYLAAMPTVPAAIDAPTQAGNGSATLIYRCGAPGDASYSDQPCAAGGSPGTTHSRATPAESCQTLRKHLADSQRDYDKAAQVILASADERGEGWRTGEASRRKAMSDLRWYGDRARLMGCKLR